MIKKKVLYSESYGGNINNESGDRNSVDSIQNSLYKWSDYLIDVLINWFGDYAATTPYFIRRICVCSLYGNLWFVSQICFDLLNSGNISLKVMRFLLIYRKEDLLKISFYLFRHVITYNSRKASLSIILFLFFFSFLSPLMF